MKIIQRSSQLVSHMSHTLGWWAVAWYAERTAIWLPQEAAPTRDEQIDTPLGTVADTTRRPEFAAIERAHLRPTAILLSSDLDAYPAADGMQRWQLLRQV